MSVQTQNRSESPTIRGGSGDYVRVVFDEKGSPTVTGKKPPYRHKARVVGTVLLAVFTLLFSVALTAEAAGAQPSVSVNG